MGADIMISSLINNSNLNDYKECNEQFIHGVRGIVRLSIGMEIMYCIGQTSMSDYFIDIPNIFKVECIFAVTDKRIILIPVDNKYKPFSFRYSDIDVVYCNQLFDKVFLLNMKDKKFLNFSENRLVFRVYSKQSSEINKINCVLQEHACV
jgi:hypothetical protein